MHKHSGRNGSTEEEFSLRGDIGKRRGVTTFIESDVNKDLERRSSGTNGHKCLKGRKWSNSASRLREGSSDEEERERTQVN